MIIIILKKYKFFLPCFVSLLSSVTSLNAQTPAKAITIQGDVSLTDTGSDTLRLNNKGPETNFLDIPTKLIFSPINFKNPGPGTPVRCLVDVNMQFEFSDYPAMPIPLLHGPVHPGAGSHAGNSGLVGNDGTPLQMHTGTEQITLSGKTSEGTTYTLTLNTLPIKSTIDKGFWSEVWISMSKNKEGTTPPPPLQFTITYNPLQSLFGVSVICGEVTLGVCARMYLQQSDKQFFPTSESALLARLITYHNDLFGMDTISMDGHATDPAIYLPIAGMFWPYTDVIGFFAPALAQLAAQTANTLPQTQGTPLSVLAKLQYSNSPGLEYPPAWTLNQFIANAMVQIGPAIGPFAVEFLPPGDSGIQPWIDAARWMGFELAKGIGVPSLESSLTAQYNFYKNYVPQVGSPPHRFPTTKPKAPGQGIWGIASQFSYPEKYN